MVGTAGSWRVPELAAVPTVLNSITGSSIQPRAHSGLQLGMQLHHIGYKIGFMYPLHNHETMTIPQIEWRMGQPGYQWLGSNGQTADDGVWGRMPQDPVNRNTNTWKEARTSLRSVQLLQRNGHPLGHVLSPQAPSLEFCPRAT